MEKNWEEPHYNISHKKPKKTKDERDPWNKINTKASYSLWKTKQTTKSIENYEIKIEWKWYQPNPNNR